MFLLLLTVSHWAWQLYSPRSWRSRSCRWSTESPSCGQVVWSTVWFWSFLNQVRRMGVCRQPEALQLRLRAEPLAAETWGLASTCRGWAGGTQTSYWSCMFTLKAVILISSVKALLQERLFFFYPYTINLNSFSLTLNMDPNWSAKWLNWVWSIVA